MKRNLLLLFVLSALLQFGGEVQAAYDPDRQPSSMQYFTPVGGQYFVGDCIPFSFGDTYYLYWLLDEGHHSALGGLGGHQWCVSTTKDLVHRCIVNRLPDQNGSYLWFYGNGGNVNFRNVRISTLISSATDFDEGTLLPSYFIDKYSYPVKAMVFNSGVSWEQWRDSHDGIATALNRIGQNEATAPLYNLNGQQVAPASLAGRRQILVGKNRKKVY